MPEPTRFRNRLAWFYWGFAAVYVLFVAAMSHVFWRDGPPPGYSIGLVLAIFSIFWLAGIGLLIYVSGKDCVDVTVHPDGSVRITRRYPLKAVRLQLMKDALPPARIVESEDTEGSPYFHCRLLLPDGSFVDLAEGHAREACETECARFNALLRAPH